MSSAPPIIEVHGLTKRYGTFTAVDGLDLTVERGEIFGILGPNGAGKTTTLEMIEGLRVPDAGSINLDGIDAIRESDRVRQIIGVQLQTTSLFEYLTAAELIELFCGLYDVENSSERIRTLLSMVNLEDKAKAQVSALSGGQRQRLSITLALVNNPKVVFLDEPTTGLDPAARRDLWQVVRDVRASGTTVVLTTHYMEEAEVLCDRVAVMDRGNVIACDTPGALIAALGIEAVVRARFDGGTLNPSSLETLPEVKSARITDDRIELNTRNVQATLVGLLGLVDRDRVSLTELTSQQSTLEDVFLSLTGRTIEADHAQASEQETEPAGRGSIRSRA
jgi:ABC-2 type transport system ATP-binding protein